MIQIPKSILEILLKSGRLNLTPVRKMRKDGRLQTYYINNSPDTPILDVAALKDLLKKNDELADRHTKAIQKLKQSDGELSYYNSLVSDVEQIDPPNSTWKKAQWKKYREEQKKKLESLNLDKIKKNIEIAQSNLDTAIDDVMALNKKLEKDAKAVGISLKSIKADCGGNETVEDMNTNIINRLIVKAYQDKADPKIKEYKSFSECKNTDEQRDYFALKHGIALTDSFMKLDKDVISSDLEGIDMFLQDFPHIGFYQCPVINSYTKVDTYARANFITGSIEFNTNQSESIESLQARRNSDNHQGWNNTTDLRAVSYHEAAHQLDFYINRNHPKYKDITDYEKSGRNTHRSLAVSSDIIKEVVDEIKADKKLYFILRKQWNERKAKYFPNSKQYFPTRNNLNASTVMEAISGYSKTNPCEAIAEAMVDMKFNQFPNFSIVSQLIQKKIKKLYSECN